MAVRIGLYTVIVANLGEAAGKIRAWWFDSIRPRMLADVPSVKAGRRQNAKDQPERCKQSGKPIRSAAAERAGQRDFESLKNCA